MNISERILQYLDFKGISKNKFYIKTGFSNGFLDKKPNIGADKIEIILSVYDDINIEWLVIGTGNMIKNKSIEYNLNQNFRKVEDNAINTYNKNEGIPLINTSAMAGLFKGDTQVLEYECERFIVPVFKEAEFLISVKGSSMNPKYNSGDIVACKRLPIDTFFQWNKVYVLDTDQGALIKRIKKATDSESLLIVSDNPKYEPFELSKKNIYGIAIVIGVIRLE